MGREKSKQARSKGLNLRLKEDRLSELPDPLICQILSNLPIKDILKTSVLSTRWRSLWLWIPSLILDCSRFPNFNALMSFGDRFFDSNRVSCIDSVKLYLGKHDASYLTSWINALIKRKIQCLNVRRVLGIYFQEMSFSLNVCETLVSLKLFNLTLVNAEFVSLPCVKEMHLTYVLFPDEAAFERLVSSCPVLEDLDIDVIWKDGKVYRVQSRTLRRLHLVRSSRKVFSSVPGVVIDAPLLGSLKIYDPVSRTYKVNNLESNAKLDIHLDFGLKDFSEASVSSKRSHISRFLSAISKVMDMKISQNTLKVIHHYSNLEPLPHFDYMSRLHVVLLSELKWLLTFLDCCPNLKSLVVALNGGFDRMHSEEMNQISFLLSISRIMDITISAYTSKVIRHNTKLELVDQFGYMSHLNVTLCVSNLKLLPIFLESCPNLESLILVLLDDKKIHPEQMNQISFSSVPECLLYSLQFVDFDTEMLGFDAEIKLVKYFLENSATLKKLTLHVKSRSTAYEKLLLKIPRRSTTCQVILI